MRVAGFDYTTQAGRLTAFSRCVGDVELSFLDGSEVAGFLNLRPTRNSTWMAKWFLLRNFFEFWRARNEPLTVEMPEQRPKSRSDFVPYIYSAAEIRRLLRAALHLRLNRNRTMDGETLRVVFLLLYATGARLKEILEMRVQDVNFAESSISLSAGTLPSPRTIPIGYALLDQLKLYANRECRQDCLGETFLVRMDGAPLNPHTVFYDFEKLLVEASLSRRDDTPYRPRISDIRATFAVHRITSWIRKGSDLGRLLPALAAYMGHKDLAGTERFLRLTPERFRKELDKLAPETGETWVCDGSLIDYVEAL
jgi:integrase/recombinase XerD